jgi:L-lactate utilization protein LutC
MKKMVLQKQELQPIAEFLSKVNTTKPKLSRKREKLRKKLVKLFEEKEQERVDIVKHYADKDENGEAVMKDNVFVVPDDLKAEMNKEIKELNEEEVAVEFGEYSANISELIEYLDSDAFEMELSGSDAYAHDVLLTAFEEANENEEEEK